MSGKRKSRTYEEYVAFCRDFQEQHWFTFDEAEVEKPDSQRKFYRYNATYRDEGNYKTNVEIRFDGRVITWELDEGWEDGQKALNMLYWSMFELSGYGGPIDAYVDRAVDTLVQIAQGIHEDQKGYTIPGPTWHIDDIRDRFPAGTSDQEL